MCRVWIDFFNNHVISFNVYFVGRMGSSSRLLKFSGSCVFEGHTLVTACVGSPWMHQVDRRFKSYIKILLDGFEVDLVSFLYFFYFAIFSGQFRLKFAETS